MKIGIQTWGSNGDILPMIALAGGLSSAGHDVSIALTSVEGRDYQHFIQKFNFNLKETGPLFRDKAEFARLAHEIGLERNPLKQLDIVLAKMFEPFADEMYSAAKKLCDENEAIIGHFVHYPVHAAAEKTGRPYVTVTLNHMGIPTAYIPPAGMPNLGRTINTFQWKLILKILNSHFSPAINRFRKRHDCPPIKTVRHVWESGLLNLLAVGQIFCKGFNDWGDNQRVCGFLNIPENFDNYPTPKGLQKFISSGSPPIYMTFGSLINELQSSIYITETTRLLVDAARLAGTRAIIQSCWDAVEDIEPNEDIFRVSAAPYKTIFPQCSSVVHHGSAGTTNSATLAGCPSVVVAHLGDQHFWGSELRRLGIALKPLHRLSVTADKLAQNIRKVLDSHSMAVRAKKLADDLKNENGVGLAVKLIEQYLGIS